MAVDPDDAVAKHAVKFDREAPAEIGFGNREFAPIPADGVFRMIRPDGAEAVIA